MTIAVTLAALCSPLYGDVPLDWEEVEMDDEEEIINALMQPPPVQPEATVAEYIRRGYIRYSPVRQSLVARMPDGGWCVPDSELTCPCCDHVAMHEHQARIEELRKEASLLRVEVAMASTTAAVAVKKEAAATAELEAYRKALGMLQQDMAAEHTRCCRAVELARRYKATLQAVQHGANPQQAVAYQSANMPNHHPATLLEPPVTQSRSRADDQASAPKAAGDTTLAVTSIRSAPSVPPLGAGEGESFGQSAAFQAVAGTRASPPEAKIMPRPELAAASGQGSFEAAVSQPFHPQHICTGVLSERASSPTHSVAQAISTPGCQLSTIRTLDSHGFEVQTWGQGAASCSNIVAVGSCAESSPEVVGTPGGRAPPHLSSVAGDTGQVGHCT